MESLQGRSEIWPETIAQAPVGIFIILLSAFLFYLSSLVTTRLSPTGAGYCSWRWKNISISFLHACISGPWALLWWVASFDLSFDKFLKLLRFCCLQEHAHRTVLYNHKLGQVDDCYGCELVSPICYVISPCFPSFAVSSTHQKWRRILFQLILRFPTRSYQCLWVSFA